MTIRLTTATAGLLALIWLSSTALGQGVNNRLYRETYGPAVSMPRTQIVLSSRVNENIRKINVEEGRRVRAGEKLIEFDSRLIDARIKVAEAEADFEARLALAEEKFEHLSLQFEMNRDMGEYLSPSELDKARHEKEAARLELADLERQHALAVAKLHYHNAEKENYVLKSPIDGAISRLWIEEGEMAQQGQKLLEVIDPHTVEVRVHLPERFTKVAPGQKALVRFTPLSGYEVEGTVSTVAPLVDSASGTFTVKVLVKPERKEVKPGMGCEVKFVAPEEN